jgi:DNA-binding MarR family transcriptional regulator
VQADSAVTQRSLARELGIALGIANATLRRCVDKGLIKVRQAPARRYAYYLTPHGFAEKSRLTAEYLTDSFRFFRDARSQCEALLAGCAARGWRRIALAGAGELAEIAQLCSANAGVELVAVIDRRQAGRTFGGLPVVADLAHVPGGTVDAVVVTDVNAPQENFDAMRTAAVMIGFDADRILAPKLLRVSIAPPPADAETST